MPSSIIRLIIEASAAHKPTISAALFAAGAGAIEEQGSRRKPRLIVYAESEQQAEELRKRLFEELERRDVDVVGVKARVEVEASDWATAWIQYLKPVAITSRFILQPVTDQTPAPDGMQRILFEPQLAFGDGAHPTTRLAARAVEDFCNRCPKSRVLDVGTGTGVLAIVARLCGAACAVGTDIDPTAIAAARANAELNDVGQLCSFQDASAQLDINFDLVVANIEMPVLLAISGQIAKFAHAARELVLTGFLTTQSETIQQAFFQLGFRCLGSDQEEEWELLKLAKISRSDG